ncbi:MAG: DUF4340 domain-containing protein [Phycisphaerales bacterium]
MNNKNLAILAAATAIVAGAAVVMNKSRSTTPSEISDGVDTSAPLLFPDLAGKAPSIAKVSLKQGAIEIALSKVGEEWVLSSKSGFPAKVKNVSDVVSWAAQARKAQEKTSKKDLYAKLGVEDPAQPEAKSILLTLTDSGGAPLASVIVGNASGAGRFARLPDAAQSYLASGSVDMSINPMSWVDTKVVQLASARLAGASFTVPNPAGGEPLVTVIKRTDPNDNKFVIENMPAGRKVKDEYVASRAAQCLAFADFEDVRPLAEVSFDSPQASSAEFRTLDHLVIRTKTIEHEGKRWSTFAAAYEPPAPAPVPSEVPAATPAANGAASIEDPATPAPAQPAAETAKEDPKAAEVRAEAEGLNKLFAKWAFVLPEFTTSRLQTKPEDLLAALEGATEGPSGPRPGG